MDGPMKAAADEEMDRFYQDLSQTVKRVSKRDMLLVMGDFNAKVGKREHLQGHSRLWCSRVSAEKGRQTATNQLTLQCHPALGCMA